MASTAERLGLTIEEMRATCGVPPECGREACRLSCCCYFPLQSAPKHPPSTEWRCETCSRDEVVCPPAQRKYTLAHTKPPCLNYVPKPPAPEASCETCASSVCPSVGTGKVADCPVHVPPKAAGEKPHAGIVNHIEAKRAEWQSFCSRLSIRDGLIHYAGEPPKETVMQVFEVCIVHVVEDRPDGFQIVFPTSPLPAPTAEHAEKKALRLLDAGRRQSGQDELPLDELRFHSRPFER